MIAVFVHYHELALKGRNRGYFERRLLHHLQTALRHLNIAQAEALPGRILIVFAGHPQRELIQERIQHTFGVANFAFVQDIPVDYTSPDLTPLCKAIEHEVRSLSFETFRITTKRADKRFPLPSIEVNRVVGAYICQQTGKRVSLTDPDMNIVIEIVNRHAYFSLNRLPGPGGLPTGTSGRVACLLSGGIDSPVAAYRMMKRGCRVVFVHFHGRPYLTRASEEKVRDLVEHLTRYQLTSRLYLIPFGETQRQIVLGSPASLRIVLYRRMMMRIAETLATRERCWALVTGESLGQVASQTPENLRVIDEVPHIPVLRPLIGMDKQEIVSEAQRIGSFEISIEPDQDCCTLFVPPHPNTKCQRNEIQAVEQRLNISLLLQECVEKAEVVEYSL
ncbi:MAG: tRNA 4-thiouridine(8) synthase ThiI [Nitrospirae bacterium]|nr:MAG: tRNA 4-thiouridine(8) synthase ThiI [Nitrospirota bacterium]